MECAKVCGKRGWYSILPLVLIIFNFIQEPEDLFETISQALLNAVDRDAMSGWGAIVYIITPDKVTTHHLKGRMD